MSKIILQNNANHLEISTFGSQILEWSHQKSPIFYTSSLPKRSGMPIMFPFCGPLKDNIFLKSGKEIAQHGFGRCVEWQSVCQEDNFVNLQLESKNLNPEYQEAYPYNFVADMFFKLDQNILTVSLNVENLGISPMPICAGFHPYFFVPKNLKKSLQIKELPEFDAQNLPWNDGVEAQFYQSPNQLTIDNISGYKITMTDQSSLTVGENTTPLPCDLMTVWAGEVADFVCVEPMSKSFDSINTNPILIPAGSFWKLEYSFEVS
jgi:galactose mutarotase-like enzyme